MMLGSAAARVRACVLSLSAVLAVLIWGWQWWPHRTLAQAIWAALCTLPLLIPLPGIIAARRNTFAWASLCITPYFVVAITEAVVNPPARGWALATLGVSLLLFFALITYLRLSNSTRVRNPSPSP